MQRKTTIKNMSKFLYLHTCSYGKLVVFKNAKQCYKGEFCKFLCYVSNKELILTEDENVEVEK